MAASPPTARPLPPAPSAAGAIVSRARRRASVRARRLSARRRTSRHFVLLRLLWHRAAPLLASPEVALHLPSCRALGPPSPQPSPAPPLLARRNRRSIAGPTLSAVGLARLPVVPPRPVPAQRRRPPLSRPTQASPPARPSLMPRARLAPMPRVLPREAATVSATPRQAPPPRTAATTNLALLAPCTLPFRPSLPLQVPPTSLFPPLPGPSQTIFPTLPISSRPRPRNRSACPLVGLALPSVTSHQPRSNGPAGA